MAQNSCLRHAFHWLALRRKSIPPFLPFYNKKHTIILFFQTKIVSLQVDMLSRQECIDKIMANSETLRSDFDVRSLRLFGSLARGEQQESSDVDVFVEMPPSLFMMVGLKYYLEDLLGTTVDVVRKHRNNDAFLLKEIEHDGIDIIRENPSHPAYP